MVIAASRLTTARKGRPLWGVDLPRSLRAVTNGSAGPDSQIPGGRHGIDALVAGLGPAARGVSGKAGQTASVRSPPG